MDIHKPKPVHSWREFLNEIAVIIVGVLIALALEQAVEQWHWHIEVVEAREALRKEAASNLGNYEFNVANRSCTLNNISVLKRLVKNHRLEAIHRATAQEALLKAGFHQYAADSTVWDTINASNMMSHMDSEERLLFATLYGYFANEKIFRLATYDRVLDLAAKGGDFDGSTEASRDLLYDLAKIDYFYRTRVVTYPKLVGQVDSRLHIKPMPQVPNDPYRCRPLRDDGTLS